LNWKPDFDLPGSGKSEVTVISGLPGSGKSEPITSEIEQSDILYH
jgi:hypothetical protein